MFFGSGAGKCKTTIVHQNALFADEFFCEASFLAHHAFISFQNKQFEDVAYFEPYYLKDFVAIKSTKDVLNSRSHKT